MDPCLPASSQLGRAPPYCSPNSSKVYLQSWWLIAEQLAAFQQITSFGIKNDVARDGFVKSTLAWSPGPVACDLSFT
jgi:hypothetical protein